jgi:hypothetical protein
MFLYNINNTFKNTVLYSNLIRISLNNQCARFSIVITLVVCNNRRLRERFSRRIVQSDGNWCMFMWYCRLHERPMLFELGVWIFYACHDPLCTCTWTTFCIATTSRSRITRWPRSASSFSTWSWHRLVKLFAFWIMRSCDRLNGCWWSNKWMDHIHLGHWLVLILNSYWL